MLMALPLLALVLLYCKPKPVDPQIEVRTTATDTMTIAKVRAFDNYSVPGQIYVTDAGKQGIFTLDQFDKTSADNTGIILVTANGERYVRQFSGSASTTWFDITTKDADIGPKLQIAVKATADLTFPDGTFTQQTPVQMQPGMSLRGNPGRTVINLTKSYISLISDTATHVPLENVLIDGLSWVVKPTDPNPLYGVLAVDGPFIKNFTVQNCNSTDAGAQVATNFLSINVAKGKTAQNILVHNNYVSAKRTGCEILNLKENNLGIYAGANIIVKNNSFSNCSLSGISIDGAHEGVLIDGNALRNCGDYGIEVQGLEHNVRITNNTFEGTFNQLISGSVNELRHGTLAGGHTITGNRTIGTCAGGIYLQNAGAATFSDNLFRITGPVQVKDYSSGGTYTNNVIESGAGNAIICDNAPNNTFTNNTISNQSSQKNDGTFKAVNNATNVVLRNNKLSKGTPGVYYYAVAPATLQSIGNVDDAGNPIP